MAQRQPRQQLAAWEDAGSAKSCRACGEPFSLLRRPKNCRSCGAVHCDACTSLRVPLPPARAAAVRCCERCFRRHYVDAGARAGAAPTLAERFPHVDAGVLSVLVAEHGGDDGAAAYLERAAAAGPSAGPGADGTAAVNREGRLTRAQLVEFYERGFLHCRGVVAGALVDAALRVINSELGRGINAADFHRGREGDVLRDGRRRLVYCPAASRHAAVRDLYGRSPVRGLVASLLGTEPRPPPDPGGAQVALTFPDAANARPERWFTREGISRSRGWHIDGLARDGEVGSFSLLVGVYLSEAPRFGGNLTVFPGAHHAMGEHIRGHGDAGLLRGELPHLDLPDPHQLVVRPGDCVLASYHLPHTVAPNVSPNVRYATYFRVKAHRERTDRGSLFNMWLDFPPLHPIVAQRERDGLAFAAS